MGFQIKMSDKPVPRRGLLASLSSVCNPLDLGAPVLLKGCQIIQNLCRNILALDEPIDDSSSYEWLKWKNQLMTLQDTNATRCIKPNNFGEVIHCSLHYFSHACEIGYDMSAYIILFNAEGVANFSLLLRKSGVAPRKFISIHRLELTASTLSAKVSRIIREEVDVHTHDEIFWTDSQVALGYINSDVQHFKIFVANGVQQIRDQTDKSQWHYLKTNNNPEDDPSRGLDSRHHEKIKRWFDDHLS